jgi:ATP-dependent helicase YprA (DUF1998 family)
MLELARAGRSALLVAATGAGKTLAGFLPTICDLAEEAPEGLHTLYVSPLKALAVDVQRNLLAPIEEMALSIRVETRIGDTPSDILCGVDHAAKAIGVATGRHSVAELVAHHPDFVFRDLSDWCAVYEAILA